MSENFISARSFHREFPSFVVHFKVCVYAYVNVFARVHAHSVNYIVISCTRHSYADAGRCNVCGIELPFAYSLSLIIPGRKNVHSDNVYIDGANFLVISNYIWVSESSFFFFIISCNKNDNQVHN